jgi:hypothetical protein
MILLFFGGWVWGVSSSLPDGYLAKDVKNCRSLVIGVVVIFGVVLLLATLGGGR